MSMWFEERVDGLFTNAVYHDAMYRLEDEARKDISASRDRSPPRETPQTHCTPHVQSTDVGQRQASAMPEISDPARDTPRMP